ncbi:MAG: 7TM-DISM domain-containing protein [Chitinophagaceae bacterium]|nr:7TM-DISM domain-containing protein [Oligoflexus sp.]
MRSLLLVLFTLVMCSGNLASEVYGAVLDLRTASDSDSTSLDVPWEFSEGPIHPGQFQVNPRAEELAAFWMSGSKLPERGTFRLTLRRTFDQPALLLTMRDMPAFRLFVNGVLSASKGKIYTSEGMIENERGMTNVLLPQADEIELIIEAGASFPRWAASRSVLTVGPEALLRNQTLVDTIVLALMLGGLFITGIYHVALYILTPSRSVTLVLGFFCLVNCVRSSVTGTVDTILQIFPHFPYELSFTLSYIGYYLSPPLFLQFIRLSFPGTISVRIIRPLWCVSLVFVSLVLVSQVSLYGQLNYLFHAVTLASIAISFQAIIRAVRSRQRGAVLLLIASTIVSLATLNDVLYAEGWPSFGPLIHYALFLFILLQSIILSSQFSSTFNELAHIYREFTKIVYLHTVKQIASGQAIESTMRVGAAEAVVVAFDIVGSSRIKSPGFTDALERMMGRCYDSMSHGYDPKLMKAPAFRLKEMGDGLLCSIGFPFITGDSRSESEVATALAADFTQIFKEEMEKLDLEADAYCSVGIVKGTVEGFFPRFGVKQYDLRGKAIMLATRYESMRNAVYQKLGWHGSVIFVQDEVYRDLSPDEQELYTLWDTTLDKQRIRDDASAPRAWFRFMPHPERRLPHGKAEKVEEGEVALEAAECEGVSREHSAGKNR